MSILGGVRPRHERVIATTNKALPPRKVRWQDQGSRTYFHHSRRHGLVPTGRFTRSPWSCRAQMGASLSTVSICEGPPRV